MIPAGCSRPSRAGMDGIEDMGMGDDRGPTDTEQLVQRARRLAVGLADTGLTQAEATSCVV